MNFIKSRFYIVAKNIKEVREAKKDNLCQFIILEDNNIIHIWKKCCIDWKYDKYVAFDKDRYRDVETTGLKAYQSFYNYCGKNEVDRMKNVLSPISLIESEEQMHFCNVDYIGEKIYSDIYVFDANSSFTFGVFQLQKEFDIMKEYYSILYDNKKNATNKIIRAKFKNLQNYLIGYFARVSGFISVRSNIIENSNNNIKEKMSKIINNGGVVYLSNTDSIVTDEKGKEVMIDFIGDKAGDFKLEKKCSRLCYKSSNIYQLDDKVCYSGVKYFARKNTDLFTDTIAIQKGSLIEEYGFILDDKKTINKKLCLIRQGEITVIVINSLGEAVEEIKYILGV